MALPKAVSSSTKKPGIYIKVNLAAGPANSGTAVQRALLVCHKHSDGNITPETEKRTCYSADDVKAAVGNASIGHLAATFMFLAYGGLLLDVVATAAPSGGTPAPATNSYTISGTPTDTNYFDFDVAGRHTGAVAWAVGESIVTFRARAILAINAMKTRIPDPIPVTASAGGTGILTLTADSNGTWGNDVQYGVTKLSGTGGTVIATASATNLASGVGEISVTNALALVDVNEYAAIGIATGNTDATDATSSSNAELLQIHMETHAEGGNALLQYGFIGHTGTIANTKAGAIGRNCKTMTYAYAQNAQSLPAEYMGWELGDAMRCYTQLRANYNRIGNEASVFLYGSKNREADLLRPNEAEDLLNSGVSPYDFAPNSTQMVLVCPITTYSLFGANPDFRCFYQSDVWGQYSFARDIRAALPIEFAHASITSDLPAGADDLPEGVIERRDVEAFTFAKARSYVRKGIFEGNALEAAIAAGEFAVEIDDVDKSQVNIFLPDEIVKPLAKFSVVMNKVG